MRNLLSYRKAQFFILSAFAIATILYFVSKWIQPAAIIDTSKVALIEEPFIFNNIKEKAIETIKSSKNCEELKYNLEEYKIFVTRFALERNFKLEFNYSDFFCAANLVIPLTIKLSSPEVEINSSFNVTWP
jgi:uncharacterized protein YpmS